jgi:hypothetical protein
MHDFILEFHNNKFYFVWLVVYGMKKIIDHNANFMEFFLKQCTLSFIYMKHLTSFSSYILCHVIKNSISVHLLKMKLSLKS